MPALSLVRTLAATITAKVARFNPVTIGRLVDISPYIVVVVVVVIGRVALIGRAVDMGLVVWPSIVPGHERLIPDGVAAVLDILPPASSSIRQSLQGTPGKAELKFYDVAKFRGNPNRPGLGNAEALGNRFVAVIAVEAVSYLVPCLVPKSPGVLIKPLLGLVSTDEWQPFSLVPDFLAGPVLNAGDVVGEADLMKLLASVLVLHNLGGSIGMGDSGDDVSARLFDKGTAMVRRVVCA